MTPNEFVRRHEPEWQALEGALATGRKASWRAPRATPGPDFPVAYRRLCQQLALARARRYPPPLVERLNALALAGHEVLYGPIGAGGLRAVRSFALAGFPRLVRQHRWPLFIALALTVVPAVLMALAVWRQPELIYALMPVGEVHEYESMYLRDGAARDAEIDMRMFTFYIAHNISVGFRCFAGGLLFGVGCVIALLYNGLLLGGLTVHLVRIGAGTHFLSFIASHSAFELPAIVLCGQAGLMLSHALLVPGRLRRIDALRQAATDAVRIVYGAAAMLVVAAFLEGFWSSSHALPVPLKAGVAALLWLLVLQYFVRMGRRDAA